MIIIALIFKNNFYCLFLGFWAIPRSTQKFLLALHSEIIQGTIWDVKE